MHVRKQQGFTLIELLIVIALIAVLAGAVIIALNPARQFQLARNSERWSHVSAIVGAVTSNTTENKGVWTCGVPLPGTASSTAEKEISSTAANICGCLVPSQMATLPSDPSGASVPADCSGTWDTGYTISRDPATKRVTVTAPGAEAGVAADAISVTQ